MNVSGPGGAAFNGLEGSVGGSLAVRYLLLLPVAAPCKSCVNSPQILIVLCLHPHIFPKMVTHYWLWEDIWCFFILCKWNQNPLLSSLSFWWAQIWCIIRMLNVWLTLFFVRFVIWETMLIATWRPPILSAPHSKWATHISAATAPSLSSHFLLVPFELVSVKLYRKCLD